MTEVHAFSKYKLSDESLESLCSLSLIISDLDMKANNLKVSVSYGQMALL